MSVTHIFWNIIPDFYVRISDVVSLKNRGKYQAINEISSILSQTLGYFLLFVAGRLPYITSHHSCQANPGRYLHSVSEVSAILEINAKVRHLGRYSTWRWCFWINLPLVAIALLAAVFLLPLRQVPGDIKAKFLKVDYMGSVLVIVSIVPILLGLTWGGSTYAWDSVPVIVPLCVGVALSVVFLVWEAKVPKLPMIPLYIFKNRTVSGVFFATFVNGMTHYAVGTFVVSNFIRDLKPIPDYVLHPAVPSDHQSLLAVEIQLVPSSFLGWKS